MIPVFRLEKVVYRLSLLSINSILILTRPLVFLPPPVLALPLLAAEPLPPAPAAVDVPLAEAVPLAFPPLLYVDLVAVALGALRLTPFACGGGGAEEEEALPLCAIPL